jgi:hypothetical protein
LVQHLLGLARGDDQDPRGAEPVRHRRHHESSFCRIGFSVPANTGRRSASTTNALELVGER